MNRKQTFAYWAEGKAGSRLDARQVANAKKMSHDLQMKNRHECQITGVQDVRSYEPKEVVVITEDSILTIKGENLHVNRLSIEQGELDLEGIFQSFVYTKHTTLAQKGENLLSRMFR